MTSDQLSWLYVDLNSYFASCEQQENPKLRGKPVAVVPLLADTTSCLAASYEAKKFGVKTGVKVGEAKRLCPQIQLVLSRHDLYIQYHHRIKAAVESCIPIESVMSVDEFACQLTGSQTAEEKAREVALRIKSTLKREIGEYVKASIGISTNKFLAKVATDMQKPDGLTLIKRSDLPQKLLNLTLRDIPGIGVKTEARLHSQNIKSMADLLKLSQQEMGRLWGGVWGERIFLWLNGADVDGPPTRTHSISHQHVLPPSERTTAGAHKISQKLLTKLAVRLRRGNFFARRLSLGVRLSGWNQEYWAESIKFDELRDTHSLLGKLEILWEKYPHNQLTPLRVDTTLSDFVKDGAQQFSFFENPKFDEISRAMDKINAKFGKEKVHLGATHDQEKSAPTRIAFRRIPEIDEI